MSYQGAGVLPYTVIDGTTYFIFGKEARHGEWSDFGGQRDDGETRQRVTAARECYEELRATINKTSILAAVVNKSSAQICERVKGSIARNYVLLVTDFRELIGDTAEKVDEAFQKFRDKKNLGYPYNEKTDITYVSATNLKEALAKATSCHEVRVKDAKDQDIKLYAFTARVLSHMIPASEKPIDQKINRLFNGEPVTGIGHEFEDEGHGRI